MGSTNFNGHTTVLTANSAVIPGETYHIKFIIADHIDQRFDSAVFIEAEGFGGAIELGTDQSICGNDLILDANINNPAASYAWFLNGTEIVGENNPTIQVNQSGTYTAQVSIAVATGSCILEDTINIEVIPFQQAASIEDLSICIPAPSDGLYDFDFPELKNDEILVELPSSNYNISYHLSQENAQNNTNPIIGIYQNTEPEETIYVRIESLDGDCLQLGSFSFTINEGPSTSDFSVFICNNTIADPGFSNLIMFNNVLVNGELDRTVTYFLNETDATDNTNPITDFPDFSSQPPFIVARIEVTGEPELCFSLAYLNFDYILPPQLFTDTLILDACIDPDYEETTDDVIYNYTNLPVFFDLEAYFDIIETSIFPGSSVRVDALLGLGNPRSYTLNEQSTFSIPLAVSFDNGNCYSSVTLKLYKNYLHDVIGEENTINACDDEASDGIENFSFFDIRQELLENIDENYSANVFVEYYETELDRTNSLNAIDQSLPYNVNNFQELYLKAYYVFNEIVACSIESKLNLQVSPTLNLNPISVDYCGNTDPTTNTTNIILQNISNIITEDLSNSSGFSANVKYYESIDDAENQENELIEFYNLSQNQQLYVRITNEATECYDVTSLDINITSAIDGTNPQPIIICDEDQNLQTTINLTNVIDELSITTDNIEFTFYETFENAQRDYFLRIVNPSNYPTTSRTVYLRAELEDESCFTIFNIEILIYADPQLNTISDIINCEVDPNTPSDFIFEDKDHQVIGNQQGMQVLYFESEADAISRENAIDKTIAYQNTSNPQTIFVRLENETGNECFKVAPIQIEVRQTPDYIAPSDVFECDLDNTGFASIDLSAKISEIELGSTTDLNTTFHLTPLNAQVGANAIPLNHTTTSNPQLIYARIENANTGCYNVETFNINTLALPEVNYGERLVACGDNYNFEQQWNLKEIELNLLDGRQFGIQYSYFLSEEDLQNNNNTIPNPESFVNTVNPQTIYTKVENTITGCFAAVPFQLILNSPPQVNPIETYNACANEENTIDLSEINLFLLDNTFNILVSYHTNEADAEANNAALNTNYNYTNTEETLYARVEFSTTGCYAVYPFQMVD